MYFAQKILIVCNTPLAIWRSNTDENDLFEFLELVNCFRDGCFMEEMARGGRGKQDFVCNIYLTDL